MINTDVRILASRMGVSLTVPELERDIDAQLRLLADPEHPKSVVFLARGNEMGDRRLPPHLFIERRAEGTLVTDSADIAAMYRLEDFISDELLAAILNYPQSKADCMEEGNGMVAQAIDKDGCVIYETAAGPSAIDAAMFEAQRQCPAGGYTDLVTPAVAMSRRIAGMN